MNAKLKPGWLKKQADYARRDIARWPTWMKREAGILKVKEMTENDLSRQVIVCDACFCASCWHGEVYCQNYRFAGIAKKTVKELNDLNLEHPCNYSLRKIEEIYGS